MDHAGLSTTLASLAADLGASGMDVRPATLLDPATEAQVVAAEEQLGLRLPASLRRVFLQVTAGVDWAWFAPPGMDFPRPFHESFCGQLDWSLGELPQREQSRQEWIDGVFPDPDDPYDAVWHGKLGLAEVGNGDLLAVDLDPAHLGSIVYLSHDDGEGHGHRMAESLGDLLDRWAPLAFAGAEDWQWLPFTDPDRGPINPLGPVADAWRRLLGLPAA